MHFQLSTQRGVLQLRTLHSPLCTSLRGGRQKGRFSCSLAHFGTATKGVRPSSAAASHGFYEGMVKSPLGRTFHVSAPEDGRTPAPFAHPVPAAVPSCAPCSLGFFLLLVFAFMDIHVFLIFIMPQPPGQMPSRRNFLIWFTSTRLLADKAQASAKAPQKVRAERKEFKK